MAVELRRMPSKEACTRFRNSTAAKESRPISIKGEEKSSKLSSPHLSL